MMISEFSTGKRKKVLVQKIADILNTPPYKIGFVDIDKQKHFVILTV